MTSNNSKIFIFISVWVTHILLPTEDTVQESGAGSGITPSCLDGFSLSVHHNLKGKKTRTSPEPIITSWQEKLSCGTAEQGSCVSQTQMSHCFSAPVPYIQLRSSSASVLIALQRTLWLWHGAAALWNPLWLWPAELCILREFVKRPLVSWSNPLPECELVLTLLCLCKGFLYFSVLTGLSLISFTMVFNPLVNTVD